MIFKRFFPLSLILSSFFSLSAAAESRDSVASSIGELTVFGYRLSENLMHLPQSVSIIDKAEIEFLNGQTTADVLQKSGLLSVQKSQQGGGSPSIRGFEASRILLVIDGVRMNNLIYRAGHLQNLITVDPSSLRQIELLYGPASVAYGSDALGGVIVMSTPDPQLSSGRSVNFFGNASARFSSVNTGTSLHADFNIGGEFFASYTSLSFNRFGDLRSGRNRNPFLPEDDSYIYRHYDVVHQDGKDVLVKNDKFWHQPGSGYLQYDLLQKFLWRPSAQFTHVLDFQFSNTGDVPRYDRLTDMKKDKPKFAQWYYGPQTRLMALYSLRTTNWAGADEADLNVAYQYIDESRHNRKLDDAWLGSRMEKVNVVSLSTDWLRRLGSHKLHAGIDGSLQFLKSTAYATDIDSHERRNLDTRYPDGRNHLFTIEGFLQHDWTINPSLTFTDGLRVGFSSLRSTFLSDEFYPFSSLIGTVAQDNPTWSLSVGLAYNPAQFWKLGVSLSTAYRVPNIDDLAKVFDSEPGMVIFPNPHLHPEQTLNADINVATFDNGVVNWTASVFGSYIFDAIALRPSSFDGKEVIDYDGEPSRIYSTFNRNRAYVVGAQTSIDVAISRNFGANANLTYTYGNYLKSDGIEGMPLDHVAPLYGKVGATFVSTNRKVKAEIFSLFNSKKPASRYNLTGEDNMGYATQNGLNDSDFQGMPAWFTLNLQVSWSPVSNITLDFGIDNILDTEYRVFASGINAPGRNFFTNLHLSF